ncbi:hypothetical protein KP509_17G009600 [Ceratopteris richardii]|uniref:Uncharacterized protein n=1 Tax=Ceratopteris richardii TaxID=49495 RepID=A0A8T2SVU8_CERRI|nr:hypothetical protein KP509_17G009600 [Ceratopteris richardii]
MLRLLLPLVSLSLGSLVICNGLKLTNADKDMNAYDVHESYAFPSGLLPRTVKDYELKDGGKFALYLNGSSTVNIPDAYPVKYASKITGTITPGTLKDLSGITVKVFMFWWNIDSISVSGKDLVFRVPGDRVVFHIQF